MKKKAKQILYSDCNSLGVWKSHYLNCCLTIVIEY